jgi:Na+-translocating ferredoxin:NAD+ oxidoreductase RnfE subunit
MELWEIFKRGLIMENPIFVLALSLCPALAVTGEATTSLTMGFCVMFVITANNTVVSYNKKLCKSKSSCSCLYHIYSNNCYYGRACTSRQLHLFYTRH